MNRRSFLRATALAGGGMMIDYALRRRFFERMRSIGIVADGQDAGEGGLGQREDPVGRQRRLLEPVHHHRGVRAGGPEGVPERRIAPVAGSARVRDGQGAVDAQLERQLVVVIVPAQAALAVRAARQEDLERPAAQHVPAGLREGDAPRGGSRARPRQPGQRRGPGFRKQGAGSSRQRGFHSHLGG